MAQSKRSESIIVNECLAFVQNKIDVMDEVSLEQICTSSFTEADISTAKKTLADSAVSTIRLATRQKDGRGLKDLQDIIRVLKQTDPDDVPTYVAQDLNKLPSVTFDHVDVTRLLKDIQLLRADVTEKRKHLQKSDETVVLLSKELPEFRKKDADQKNTPSPSQNVDTRRGGARMDPISPLCTNMILSPVESPKVIRPIKSSTCMESIAQPVTAPTVATSCQQQKTYAEVSRKRKVLPKSARPAPIQILEGKKGDADGFTLIEKKRRRPKQNRNKRGTAPTADAMLKAAMPNVKIYVSRVNPKTSKGDVIADKYEDRYGASAD